MRSAKQYFLAVGLLAGTIIGAGVFFLPYIFKLSGIGTGFFYLALAAAAYIIAYYLYADMVLRTPGEHRFVGYARLYLGKYFSWLAVLMTIVEMVLVLTVYLILSQSFGNLITAVGSGMDKLVIFWVLGSAAIFLGLRRIAWLEFLITVGIMLIIALIFILGFSKISEITGSDFAPVAGNFLLPLAPVLFALSGRVAIPALVRLVQSGPDAVKIIRRSIAVGTLLPAAIYAIFVLSIIALSPAVSEDAVSGLVGYIPGWAMVAIGIFGSLSLLSSYITVGFDVYKSLVFDLKLPIGLQMLIVVIGPLALYFAGLTSFIALVSFVGGVFLALEGLFIVLMWLKANKVLAPAPMVIKKMHPIALAAITLVFAAALIYEILK